MKFAVIAALIATASAQDVEAGCVISAADKTVANAPADAVCTADQNCGLCVCAAGVDSVAGQCVTCAEGYTLADVTDDVGTCAADGDGEGDGDDANLAGLGEVCSPTEENSGCIAGHRCGTTAAIPADTEAGTEEVPETITCVAEATCDEEGVTCGAMQLGASLVAAVAIANLM